MTPDDLKAKIIEYAQQRDLVHNDPESYSSIRPGPRKHHFFETRQELDAMIEHYDGEITSLVEIAKDYLIAHKNVEQNTKLMMKHWDTAEECSKNTDECAIRMEILEDAEMAMMEMAVGKKQTTSEEFLLKQFPNLGKQKRYDNDNVS